jgi:FKBP-type peptidyl-prolyl cis-trans isomerase SlyD
MSNTVQNNKVISIHYSLKLADGELVDQSDADEPLEYLHGAGNIVPGLEAALTGLKVGDKKNVVVSATDGYGEYDEEAVQKVNRSELPDNFPAEEGESVEVVDESGEVVEAYIKKVERDFITLDYNHPLAGQALHFSVEIVEVRDATEEELEMEMPASMFDDFGDYDDDDEFFYDDEEDDGDDRKSRMN